MRVLEHKNKQKVSVIDLLLHQGHEIPAMLLFLLLTGTFSRTTKHSPDFQHYREHRIIGTAAYFSLCLIYSTPNFRMYQFKQTLLTSFSVTH